MTPLNLDQLLRVAEEATPAGRPEGWQLDMFGKTGFTWAVAADADAPDVLILARRREDALYVATFDPPTVKALIEQNRALVEANEALLVAMSWIESPFVEGADESELRNRIKFARQDAERAEALLTALLSQEEDA